MTDVLVLTAAKPIDQSVLDAVAAALALTGWKRRSDHWAEAPIFGPTDLDPLRIAHRVDLNILPKAGRRKSILIADMDSTMIPVECIDELADFAGVKPQVEAITDRAMRGELDFEQAIDARVALLRDLPQSALQACYDQRVHLNPGARVLVGTMNRAGSRTALVSGGFTFFSQRVAAAAGFQSHQANVLEIENGHLTGRVQKPVLGQQAKAEALAALCAERGISTGDALAIGDGANDLVMIREAGLGVAYRAKPALRAEADAILDHSDLTAVLALQGMAAMDVPE
ncbi:MAG: phosphoserine phosphatase SerB [Pseudomonadota bacterium]